MLASSTVQSVARDALGDDPRVTFVLDDGGRFIRGQPAASFDLVFADPPYGKGLGEKALTSLVKGEWLNPCGIVVLEESQKAEIKDISGLALIDERDYGETKIRFYRGGQREDQEA